MKEWGADDDDEGNPTEENTNDEKIEKGEEEAEIAGKLSKLLRKPLWKKQRGCGFLANINLSKHGHMAICLKV